MQILPLLEQANAAKAELMYAQPDAKNKLLAAMATALLVEKETILQANAIDLQKAKGNIADVMLDRLRLTSERIDAMAQSVRDVIALDDPTGKLLDTYHRPNGLEIQKISVPFGVIAAIYESRPNVTADIAALCIKSGNVCVLRGGKEAIESNRAIAKALQSAITKEGFPSAIVTFIDDVSRESSAELMKANGYVDLLIPRGGAGLIRTVVQQATVPIIETGIGICHLYVDEAANLDMAAEILYNGKVQRPSVCNSLEVCLVHKAVAATFLPRMQALFKNVCELRFSTKALPFVANGKAANETDFDTEFLDYILSVHVVEDVDEAIEHIAKHSSHHSEVIITENNEVANTFLTKVDSAAVYHNASTRFTDGGEFGFGCEIGISTQKLGARGPMGLAEMTSYKYIIRGDGQIR